MMGDYGDIFAVMARRPFYRLPTWRQQPMTNRNEGPWYVDPNRQQAIVAAVVSFLAFVAWLVYGLFNEGDGVTVDDLKAAITPLVTGVLILAGIFRGRKFSFAPKTVVERTDASLKDEAGRLR